MPMVAWGSLGAVLTGLIARAATFAGGGAATAAPVRLDGVRSTACGSGVARAAYSASVCQSLEVEKMPEIGALFLLPVSGGASANGTLQITTSNLGPSGCETLAKARRRGAALYRPYKSSGLAALHV